MDTVKIDLHTMKLSRSKRSAYLYLGKKSKMILDTDINSSGDMTLSFLVKYNSAESYALLSIESDIDHIPLMSSDVFCDYFMSRYFLLLGSLKKYLSRRGNISYETVRSILGYNMYNDLGIEIVGEIKSEVVNTIIENTYSKIVSTMRNIMR